MKLAWGKKVDQAFHDKVFAICDSFKWNRETHASWLMSCMAFESGETFSPSVRNAAGSGATGLIQFMPSTAKDLGTSTTELADNDARARNRLATLEKSNETVRNYLNQPIPLDLVCLLNRTCDAGNSGSDKGGAGGASRGTGLTVPAGSGQGLKSDKGSR